MYDHQTESLWSQVLQHAVTGPMTDTELTRLPSTLTTWATWRKKHPDSEVLTPATGHVRDYSKDPYEDYYESRSGLFGFLKGGPGAEDKELVIGIEVGGTAKAYKLKDLRSAGEIKDSLGNINFILKFDEVTDNLTAVDQTGEDIGHMILYWFVWKSVYPEAQIYK